MVIEKNSLIACRFEIFGILFFLKKGGAAMLNIDHVKLMLNKGYLTLETAMFIHKQGYNIICGNGQVEQIEAICDED